MSEETPETTDTDQVVGAAAFDCTNGEGKITVTIPATHAEFADYSVGPMLSLILDCQADGLELRITDIHLDEDDITDLIAALHKALIIEQQRAGDRGHYLWVAAGQPDINTEPDHPFWQGAQHRTVSISTGCP